MNWAFFRSPDTCYWILGNSEYLWYQRELDSSRNQYQVTKRGVLSQGAHCSILSRRFFVAFSWRRYSCRFRWGSKTPRRWVNAKSARGHGRNCPRWRKGGGSLLAASCCQCWSACSFFSLPPPLPPELPRCMWSKAQPGSVATPPPHTHTHSSQATDWVRIEVD